MAKPTVLIIAPMDVFTSLQKILVDRYEIAVALDGKMARSVLKRKIPELIMLDVRLSASTSGDNVLPELRADDAPTQSVPIILLTHDEDDYGDWLRHDVSDHLASPYKDEEVHRRVATLVSLRRSQLAEGDYSKTLEGISNSLEEKNKILEILSGKLSKYLSTQVFESIFSGERDVALETERKKLTVFFSDIMNFTQTTEDLQPEDLTYLLNSYFTEMSKIALEYGATIDKFIGDAMMLFFGDPETKGVKEDAQACVQMAIAMQRKMAELEKEWRARGYEKPFRMRIGINTGYCNVGNFGSEDRMDYTIIGGEVNLAARLEGQADPGGILMSYETFSLVEDIIQAEPRDGFEAKGIRREIIPYAVTGILDELESAGKIVRLDRTGLSLLIDFETLDSDGREAAIEDIEQALEVAKSIMGSGSENEKSDPSPPSVHVTDPQSIGPIGDKEKMDEFRDQLNSETVSELLNTAQETLRARMESLHQGLAESDHDLVHEIGHSIKGACGSMYAPRISELGAIVEMNSDDLDVVRRLMPELTEVAEGTLEWWRSQMM